MPDLKKYREQILLLLSRLTRIQQIVLLAGGVLLLGGLIFLIVWITTPSYSVLFSDLSPEDASAIVLKLKDNKVTYKIENGGTAILVPSEIVYEQRLALAGEGLPKRGGVGFEIFDKTNLSNTIFTENTNYQRALQGELCKTIRQLEGVEDCRVHIAISKPRLLSEVEQEATASVVLYLKSGVSLTTKQVDGIIHLVASSIVGLKPENISVLDNYGNVISDNFKDKDNPFGNETITKYYSLKKNIERDLQIKVQKLLDSVVGPNRSVVQISVEVNLDKKEISKETYIPLKGINGVLRSEQVLQEKYQGSGQPPKTTNTDQTVPSYPAAAGQEGKNKYNRTESISNYEISSEKVKQTAMPGDIKYITVGVGIDKNLNLPPEDLTNIKDIVANSIGLDQRRGDQIKVAAIVFNNLAIDQTKGLPPSIGSIPLTYIYYLGAFILVLFIIMFIMLSRRKQVAEIEEKQEPKMITSEGAPQALEDKSMPSGEKIIDLGIERFDLLSLEDKQKAALMEKMFEDVKTLSTNKPDDVALLFRVWLSEDE